MVDFSESLRFFCPLPASFPTLPRSQWYLTYFNTGQMNCFIPISQLDISDTRPLPSRILQVKLRRRTFDVLFYEKENQVGPIKAVSVLTTRYIRPIFFSLILLQIDNTL